MMNEPSVSIDGLGPLPRRRPDNVAELGEVVREASRQELALYPVGGETMLGLGNSPARPGVAVDVTALESVIDYPARDMTITVQAGMRLARLQELLAPENQQLPVDVPRPERATLGGAIACNVSGPRRFGYGTLRDYVLGIHVVNDEGAEFKAGGRVVKNVAGYDLCKLLVGSLGTLGIITQVTLKLRPLPDEQALVALACPDDGLAAALELLHGTQTRPMCLDVLNRRGAALVEESSSVPLREAPWTIVIGYEGNQDTVRWQVRQLILELRGRYPIDSWLGRLTRPLWQALAAFQAHNAGDDWLTFKANVRPAQAAAFCRRAAAVGADMAIQCHAGNGIVRGHLLAPLGQARDALTALRAGAQDGKVIVQSCPTAWKETIAVWGEPGPDAWLMRRVKEQFDPRRLFNPGRFVGGI
ncbi:MAG: FAD-binding oxidoreductase [Planctomycetes bacterium]|nr:FAD-binding oxidoreductase [Planctomycetota bacterium]